MTPTEATQLRRTMTTDQIRYQFSIPANAFVSIPDEWKLAGQQMNRHFQVVSFYSDGQRTLSESALLLEGIAEFRVQLGSFKQQAFNIRKP